MLTGAQLHRSDRSQVLYSQPAREVCHDANFVQAILNKRSSIEEQRWHIFLFETVISHCYDMVVWPEVSTGTTSETLCMLILQFLVEFTGRASQRRPEPNSFSWHRRSCWGIFNWISCMLASSYAQRYKIDARWCQGIGLLCQEGSHPQR